MIDTQQLFISGRDGYAVFHIPGLVVTPDGTVLAYGEGRRTLEFGDWAPIDVVLRRSFDNGRTWDPLRVLVTAGEHTVNNPYAISDPTAGCVHFLYCTDYARVFYIRSDDNGATFSAPVEITGAVEQFRNEYDWNVVATGPGHGVCLRSGRVIVPVWLGRGELMNNGNPRARFHDNINVGILYSDDHGKTWHCSPIVARHSDGATNPNETSVVELSDGRVMLNIRNQGPENRKLVAVSPDGVSNWSRPVIDAALFEPVCMAGIVRVDVPNRGSRILLSHPDSRHMAGDARPGGWTRYPRENLTIRVSKDDGQTWPIARVIDPGSVGYSDLAVARDGTILCLYGCGIVEIDKRRRAAGLSLARMDLGSLESSKESRSLVASV